MLAVIDASSLFYINLWSVNPDITWREQFNHLLWTDAAGFVIWLIGYIFAWLSDRQLSVHLATPKKKR